MRILCGITSLLLLAGAAHANEIDGASCTAEVGSAQETFDAIMAARPKTVIEPHDKVALCAAPPTVRFDREISSAQVSLTIPLSSLATAPMTAEDFGSEIANVEIPHPWGDGKPATWSVKNGAIQIQSPAEITAWGMVKGEVVLALKSGQQVVVDVASPSITIDLTANHLSNLAVTIDSKIATLAFEQQQLERMKSWAADPSIIPFRSEAARTADRAELAKADADIATLRPQLQKSWSTTSASDRLAVYLSIGADDPSLTPLVNAAVPQNNAMVSARESAKSMHDMLDSVNALTPPLTAAQLAPFLADAANADAALAKATAAYQATVSAFESAVAQKHLEDKVLGRAQSYFSPDHSQAFENARRLHDDYTRDLAGLDQLAAKERSATLASFTTEIPRLSKANADEQTAIDGLKAELAAGAPVLLNRSTRYDSGCPAPLATR